MTLAVGYGRGAGEPPGTGCEPPGLVGEVAHARHADYHELLATPLKALAAAADELGGPGTKSLWYVATRARCWSAIWRSGLAWASPANIPT